MTDKRPVVVFPNDRNYPELQYEAWWKSEVVAHGSLNAIQAKYPNAIIPEFL